MMSEVLRAMTPFTLTRLVARGTIIRALSATPRSGDCHMRLKSWIASVGVMLWGCLTLSAQKSNRALSPFDQPGENAEISRYYVMTNDAQNPNTATFYAATGTGLGLSLMKVGRVKTGGSGGGDGYFAAPTVAVLKSSSQDCAFVSDTASGDIAAINLRTQKVVGNFRGSVTDGDPVTLATDNTFLYVSFYISRTIGTFQIGGGCDLTFIGDVTASGLADGTVDGMALRGNMLLATYLDGSIESFNTSHGIPVSNNDEQYSTAFMNDGGIPAGVDITRDGHFAIFGDANEYYVEVEVSDISAGKLSPTVEYGGPGEGLGPGMNSNNVRLSPDESLLYISVNSSGEVAAAFFEKTTGVLTRGCTSSPLKGFNTQWKYTLGLASALTTGTGSILWVAEDSQNSFASGSSVGIVQIVSNSGKCALTELPNSPAADTASTALFSIGAYPPRPF